MHNAGPFACASTTLMFIIPPAADRPPLLPLLPQQLAQTIDDHQQPSQALQSPRPGWSCWHCAAMSENIDNLVGTEQRKGRAKQQPRQVIKDKQQERRDKRRRNSKRERGRKNLGPHRIRSTAERRRTAVANQCITSSPNWAG